MRQPSYTIALIGNPNVGKSVIFNNLVPGARQHVGNWPGKTVEKKEGTFTHYNTLLKLVDLPGTYSLTAAAEDEMVSRNYIIQEKPDLVVDVIDASNLERNLYLTTLLLELDINLLLVLNMTDIAEEKGYKINVKALSEKLGVPIITTIATKGKGLVELKEAILKAAQSPTKKSNLNYGKKIESIIASIVELLKKDPEIAKNYPLRWLSIKALEKDEQVLDIIRDSPIRAELMEGYFMNANKVLGEDPDIALADARYEQINKIIEQTLVRGKRKWTFTDILDKVFLNKYIGIPAFFALLWAVFQFTFEASAPFMSLIEMFFAYLSGLAAQIPNEIVASLLADGIFSGLGFILTFTAPIFFLFFALSILEDSGYLARVAFVFDKLMFKLGLHGRSFIPMLLGFGCNIPAIMAARSVEGKKDRLITILTVPFMSCAARLPVYVLIAGAFFPANAAAAVWAMYIIGIFVGILFALLLRKTILKGEPAPFIIELPTYKMPTIKGSVIHMWERGVSFLKKAGTYLLVGAVIIWLFSVLPWGVEPGSGESLIGLLGQTLQPLFAPLGFSWQIVSSLVFAFLAKELVVESLGVIYGVAGEASIQAALIASITPVSAFALMVFTLLYVPCLATVGVIKKETGSWKWTLFAVVSEIAIAYIAALLIVTIGGLLV